MKPEQIEKIKTDLANEILLFRKEGQWDKVAQGVEQYRQLLDTLLQGEDLLLINDCFYLTLYEIEANDYIQKSHLNYRRILYALSLLEKYPDNPSDVNTDTMELLENISKFKADGYTHLGDKLFDDHRAKEALCLYEKALCYLLKASGPESDKEGLTDLLESVAVCCKYLSGERELARWREIFSPYLSLEEIDKTVAEARAPFLKHDPVEDTEEFLQIKEEMEALLYEHFGGQEQYMGFCFEYWSKKSELLSSKYGIEWRSPSLMNPRVLFD